MPLPEGYLPREGDVLTIEVEVKYDVDADDKNVHVFPVGARYRDFSLPVANIIGIALRKWKDGEGIISTEDENIFGVAVCVNGEYVVMKLDRKAAEPDIDGGLIICHCNELLPWPGEKPGGQEPPEAPAGIPEAPPAPPLSGED
jgi:hypothetical protein